MSCVDKNDMAWALNYDASIVGFQCPVPICGLMSVWAVASVWGVFWRSLTLTAAPVAPTAAIYLPPAGARAYALIM